MANSFLAAAGSSERIDHRSLQTQHEEALEKAAVALDNEEKVLWLAKAAEQAVRDAAKQEAVEVYKTFSELDLEIVVDVRSFTVAALAEPEEIVLPETSSGSSTHETQRPVLVAPVPHTRVRGVKSYRNKDEVSKVVINTKSAEIVSDADNKTILKTSPSKISNRASRSIPDRVNRKTAPHVRIISLNALQLFWLILSEINSYGLKQTKLKLILLVKNMINVLLKTTSLTKY